MSIICSGILQAQQNGTHILLGRTTGPLPYLNYGLGEDRLGGAKMTFLDSNIVMRVTDSLPGVYRVSLSKNHFAFLPKENFKADASIKPRPYYLTNSWKVYGDDKYDYVTVLLDEKLPYRSIQQIDPSRIVVEIFGATSNTNWITQLSTAKEIRNVYYEQPEDDVFRVVIELKHNQHWGFSIYYEENKLTVKVKRQPTLLTLKNFKVAVDAGHGGDNEGTRGVKSGVLEKDYTLKIAKQLEKALQKEHAKVFMTREKDTSLSMLERTTMLKQWDPDILVSIHLNSSDKDTIKGTSTYYRYIGFRPLSKYILKHLLELKLAEYGNIGSFNFSLSGPTEYPNCLVEVAFLSNKEDEKKILNPNFQKAVALKIVAGIKEWLLSQDK